MAEGVTLKEKGYEQILKEKVLNLKKHVSELETELEAFKTLSIDAVLRAGYTFDSKQYKELVRLTDIKTIILAKISKGIALSDKEKEYLTKNLK